MAAPAPLRLVLSRELTSLFLAAGQIKRSTPQVAVAAAVALLPASMSAGVQLV